MTEKTVNQGTPTQSRTQRKVETAAEGMGPVDRRAFLGATGAAAATLAALRAHPALAAVLSGAAVIEGYTNGLSFAAGETVSFHVSTNAPRYSVRIVRSGVTEEIVWERGGIEGAEFPVPDRAWETGAGWPAAFDLEIPDDWTSGYYIVTFMTEGVPGHRDEWHHFFVVRGSDARPNKAALLIPTSTLHAYNNWGGSNLYEGGHKVSVLRPITRGFIRKPDIVNSRVADIGEPNDGFAADVFEYLEKHGFPMWVGAAGWASYEQPFVQWAEGEGYAFDYITSEDLEYRPEILERYDLVVSVGHDEY